MYDLVIQGGQVIDGTGSARQKLDIAIQGDRIAELGSLAGAPAKRTINAAGKIVAPGVIDVHTHSDGWLLKIPYLASKISQGITTEVLMSDGISYAPITPENHRDWFLYMRTLNGLELSDYTGWRSVGDYLDLLDGRCAQNVVCEVPYANVRVLAAGWGRTALDDTQIKFMQREIDRSMAAGAVGVSTGLDYIVQCFATTDEIAEVCSVLRPYAGLYVTHVRYKKGTLRGVQEAVEIGRRAGVPVHISHLKGVSPSETEQIIEYIDRVAVKEVDFSFDVYPYLPGSTQINYILPYEVWEDGPLSVCEKLRDPAVRERFADLIASFSVPMDRLTLAWVSSKANTRFQGMTCSAYARSVGKPIQEALADLLIEEHLGALAVIGLQPDELIKPFLAHDKFMLGSDGIWHDGAHIHPRMFGSAPRILGPMVREKKLFSLESAVRKLCGFPAERFGLVDRGVLRTGAFADVMIFDPATITDRATYAAPQQLSVGIDHVLVNGVSVWNDGAIVKTEGAKLPGRSLRFKK